MTTGWLKQSMSEASEDVKKLPDWAVQLAMAMDPVAPTEKQRAPSVGGGSPPRRG
jgi:hypothetical protein